MAFVVTAGQIAAVQRTDMAWASVVPSGVRLSASLSMTYDQLWRTQPALRTVVGFLARNVAQLGIDPYQRVSDTDRVKLRDHPLARLLERPWRGSKLTKYRLLNTIMHDLCIYDDAYLLKVKLGGELRGILPIPPRMVTPQGGNWFMPDKYRIDGGTSYREVDADQMVHIHGYNPADPRQGVPPIETLRQILAEEHAATSYREQLWRNGARVAGYLKRPREAPKWSDPARDRFRLAWQGQYAGDGPASGGTPILEDGMEFVPSGVSPKDAQYVESRKLTREEVAVAYHVSPSMIGLMEGTNFSSIQELHRMLYQDTLSPYLTQIAQDLENQLLEDVDPGAADGTVYIEFNLAEKLRGSFNEQASAIQSAVGAPWMTRAEARSLFNMSEVVGADELIVPLNVLEGGLASPNDTAPDNPSNGSEPKGHSVLRGTYERQLTAVLTRIGTNARPVLDRDRWDAELAADLKTAGIAGPELARHIAANVNQRTEERLHLALPGADPKVEARRVFAELIQEAA